MSEGEASAGLLVRVARSQPAARQGMKMVAQECVCVSICMYTYVYDTHYVCIYVYVHKKEVPMGP